MPWTPEVWAKGFRNPFRFSFDRANGDLYIGDAGEGTLEETDVERADSAGSLNYGWDVRGGTNCSDPDPGEVACDDTALVDPVRVYDSNGGDCSVTGGSVYRGSASAALRGLYFFSDFCGHQLWTFRWNRATGVAEELTNRTSEFPPSAGGGSEIFQPVAITPKTARANSSSSVCSATSTD